MPYIEAKTPVGKTVMSLFFTGMALVGLFAGLNGNGGAWFVFLAFGGCAIYAWRNTFAHQRSLEEQASRNLVAPTAEETAKRIALEMPGLPQDGKSQTKEVSNDKDTMKCARGAHESLEPCVELLRSILNVSGINREKASLSMAALIEKMGAVSNEFPPAIVSLALTFVWNFEMDRSSDVFKDYSELALKSRQAVTGLGQSLADVLKDEGWTKEAVTEQMSSLTEKLLAVTAGSNHLIFTLTVAVTLDNYAKFLISETLLPRETKQAIPQKAAPPVDFRGDYGPVKLVPSADANAILTSMTKEERLNFDGALAHLQKWYDSSAGAQGPVSFHPESRAALWGTALAKIADHFHGTGSNDRAFFFTDNAWKISKYPVFAFNAGILSMALGDYAKAKSLFLAYLDGYQKVLATSTFQLIDSKITKEKLEQMAQTAQGRLAALDAIKEA